MAEEFVFARNFARYCVISALWEQIAVIEEHSIGNVDDHGSREIAQTSSRYAKSEMK